MDLHIENRRALITGSTAGIGFAIAHGLAAEGAHVVITGRTQPAVDAALARLRNSISDARAEGIAADCASAEGAETVFGRVPDVDILVNNLGIYERRQFFEIPDDEWLRMFEVNVLSGVRFARRYAPAMAKRGWGRVLFISSESALNVPREMIHYGTTKTAQLTISHGLAMELAGTGVTVNAVLPGPTRTETRSDCARSARRPRGSPYPSSSATTSSASAQHRFSSALPLPPKLRTSRCISAARARRARQVRRCASMAES